MHARPFVRSPDACDSFGALYDRGSGKLTERAAMTTHNTTCVNAFNAQMVSLARRLGSLKVSTTSLLYPEKQTLARVAGTSH
jgi:hypothetical protein